MKFVDAALKATTSMLIPDFLKTEKLKSANALKALKTFPPRREQWKYTLFPHINHLLYSDTQNIHNTQNTSISSKTPYQIVFNEGLCQPESFKNKLPQGVSIKSLTQQDNAFFADQKTNNLLKESFFQSFLKEEPILEHLNILLCKDIYFITVAPHTILDFPLHIEIQRQSQNMMGCRLFFHLQEGSQLKLSIHIKDVKNSTQTQKDIKNLLTFCCRARLEDTAHLDIYFRQSLDAHSTLLTQNYFDLSGHKCSLKSIDVHLGQEYLRHNRVVHLKGLESQAFMHSLSLLQKQSHSDSHFYIQHIKPQTQSRLNARSILLDHARYVFNGLVGIDQKASKSDSHQSSKSLILSPFAEADVKPELDVFADDVKATHGATVGQIHEDEIFYLQSRGLPYKEALQSLSISFLQSMLEQISDEDLREEIHQEIQKNLSSNELY